MQREV